MFDNLLGFFIHWGITAVSLWGASLVFKGIRFSSTSALIISALLLGFANAVLRPLLVILTFPLTLITLGLFVLVINALLLAVTAWIAGRLDLAFRVDGFWAAFFGALVISAVSLVASLLIRPPRVRRS